MLLTKKQEGAVHKDLGNFKRKRCENPSNYLIGRKTDNIREGGVIKLE